LQWYNPKIHLKAVLLMAEAAKKGLDERG